MIVQGKRVPESYCNFYIANEIVIMPTFGFRETDDLAAGILQDLMPERRVISLDASDFIWGLGWAVKNLVLRSKSKGFFKAVFVPLQFS